METASMGVKEDHLSKVFVAGPRTQPDPVTSWETEQCITGTAMASLASISLDMENNTHTVHSMSQNMQATSRARLETHSAQDTIVTTLVNIINKATPNSRESWPENLRVSSELSTIGPVGLHSEKRIIPTAPQD